MSSTPFDAIRHQMRQKRARLPRERIDAASQQACQRAMQLPAFNQARTIAAYMPVNGEIRPDPLIAAAWRQHKRVYLPVLTDNRQLLFGRYHPESELRANRYRIPEPVVGDDERLPAEQIDLIIVPLVAFDACCHRIGMGAGFYDRSLVGHHGQIGLAYDFQCIDRIQPHPWDIPMNAIATETRLYRREPAHTAAQKP